MADNTDPNARSGVSRRTFVKATGASGVAAGLAGCIYGGGGGSDSNTIQFGTDPAFIDAVGEEAKELMHDAGLSDDITIEWAAGNEETGARRDNYNRLLNTGESQPDILMMDNGWVNVFIQQGLLENLSTSDAISDDVVSTVDSEYFEGFTATARNLDGELFGVPMYPDFPTMQYRKDLAEDAGYNPESDNWATEPMTWAEWSQITADIQEQSGVDYGFTTQWDIYVGTACCTFNEVMTSWGGAYFGGRENLFGPVGDRPVTVDSEETINGLRMMTRFVQGDSFSQLSEDYAGGIAPTEITSWNEEDSRTEMVNGNAVMHRNWPYAIANNASEDNFGEDYGAMPIPYAVSESNAAQQGAGGSASALGGWHATVNPNSDKTENINEVLEVLTTDEWLLGILELYGWVPPKPELFNSEEAQNLETMGRYMDTLRVAGENTIARPVTSVWPDQVPVVAEEANRAVAGEKDPAQAMSDLQSSLEDIESSA